MNKILIFVVMLTSAGMNAQPADYPVYENHNMVDYGPLVFRYVVGRAIDPGGAPLPGGNIGLFTEQDHRLVASTRTDAEGNFHLHGVAPGHYRLVAHFDGCCPANVRVRLARWPRGGVGRRLVIHGVVGAIDTCSYGSYK